MDTKKSAFLTDNKSVKSELAKESVKSELVKDSIKSDSAKDSQPKKSAFLTSAQPLKQTEQGP